MRGRGECSVRQRQRANGSSYWEARASIHGRQVSFYAATKTAALAKARQARADAERGVAVLLPTVTVGAYLPTWLEVTVRPKARASTHRTYERVCVKHLIPALGQVRLAHLTPAHVEALLASMVAAGYSETTAGQARGVLGTALAAAQRDLGLPRNVARLARLPRTSATPFRPERLTVADVRLVGEAVRGHRVEPAVLFSIATGVRHGELLALSHDDLDLTDRVVTIRHSLERGQGPPRIARPKSDSGVRVLALSDMAMRALELEAAFQAQEREIAGPAWQDTGVVFARENGQVQSVVAAGRRLRACTDRAGLPPLRWHALRRMFAALLLDQGVPLHRIRDLLGHSHVAVTEHYAYTMPEALARDLGAIDRALTDS